MLKRCVFSFLFTLAAVFVFAQAKVLLLPVLHGLHKTNTSYNYDSLKNLVSRFEPQIVAVEMRQYDLGADTLYLSKNYPREMWMARYWFPGARIEGYDWLGPDLEGQSIPAGYWRTQSPGKLLERQLDSDSVYSGKLSGCNLIVEERLPVLSNGSVNDIIQNDTTLVRKYYDCLAVQLNGSSYETLNQFYVKRNQMMAAHISQLVNKNPGTRMVILTGADHYPYLLDHLRRLNVVLLHP